MDKTTISSPFFPQDFADYLTESGYKLIHASTEDALYGFISGDTQVVVQLDKISRLEYTGDERDIDAEGETCGRYGQWVLVNQYNGLQHLRDFPAFAWLMDSMGIVSIRKNLSKLARASQLLKPAI